MDTNEIGLMYIDWNYVPVMLLSLAIIIALFSSLRFFSGVVSHIDPDYELTKKDNTAYGISLAGVVFGVTLVLSGAIPSSWAMSFTDSIIAVGVYGVLGIVLMVLSRLIFDRIALPRISIRDEIVAGNNAAAIIDAGNVIASALVIRAVMRWIEINTLDGIGALLLVYCVSQVILTIVAILTARIFTWRSNGLSIQEEFRKRNTALALRFAGRRIGVAFAITAASQSMVYEIYEVYSLIFVWVILSCVMIALLAVLSWIASRLILFGVRVHHEVITERNLAIGAVQGTLYIALGILLAALMA